MQRVDSPVFDMEEKYRDPREKSGPEYFLSDDVISAVLQNIDNQNTSPEEIDASRYPKKWFRVHGKPFNYSLYIIPQENKPADVYVIHRSPYALKNFEISKGSFGKIKLGINLRTKKKIAIKTIYEDVFNGSIPPQVHREQKILNRLRKSVHFEPLPRQENPAKFDILMEWEDGITLNKLIRNEGLSLVMRREIARQTLLAVQNMHQRGILHGDLSPSNIMVNITPGGPLGFTVRVSVIDFGLALEMAGNGEFVSTALQGTAEYIAPELRDAQKRAQNLIYSEKTEAYALGRVMQDLFLDSHPDYQMFGKMCLIAPKRATIQQTLDKLNSMPKETLSPEEIEKDLAHFNKVLHQNDFSEKILKGFQYGLYGVLAGLVVVLALFGITPTTFAPIMLDVAMATLIPFGVGGALVSISDFLERHKKKILFGVFAVTMIVGGILSCGVIPGVAVATTGLYAVIGSLFNLTGATATMAGFFTTTLVPFFVSKAPAICRYLMDKWDKFCGNAPILSGSQAGRSTPPQDALSAFSDGGRGYAHIRQGLGIS
ncbi:MAG TPA: protein kinase, partial [Gammaproteobacteria bacterium]|nr:protein kinase [Gammaproteobacteria bacterium]